MKKLLACLATCSCSLFASAQVGIGTTSPHSTLDVRGSFATGTRTLTASATLDASDHVVLFTGASAAAITLPDATTCLGRIYQFRNASTAATPPVVTISTSASQTIDGGATWLLDESGEAVSLISNGTGWTVLSQTAATSLAGWNQNGNAVGSQRSLGTTTNFALPFITNNTERMRLTASGNLGIGTTSPTQALGVNGNIHLMGANRSLFFDASGDPLAGIKNLSLPGEVNELLLFSGNDQAGSYGADRIRLASHEIHLGTSSLAGAVNTGDPTSYYESTTNVPTRLFINEQGSVGIGTTTFDPDAPEKLLIDAGTTTSNTVIGAQGSINSYLQLNVQNFSNGNSASSDIVATANNGTDNSTYIDMGINSAGYTNSNSNILNGGNTAYLYANAAEFFIGNGATNRNLIFFTNTGALGNSTANGTERMRITAGGTVSINSSSPNTSHRLFVNGSVYASSYFQPSDRRLKSNVRRLGYGLREVMALRPVSYRWKERPEDGRAVGLIAQELRKVIPEAVAGNEKTETLRVDYVELIPVLINAIQEQQKQIDELKALVRQLAR
jgi:hypothetical protein